MAKATEGGVIVKDKEISALNRINKLLAELTAGERSRVLKWLVCKYSECQTPCLNTEPDK
jgi:hypothetical protein